MRSYEDAKEVDLPQLENQTYVLLVTATDVETEALHLSLTSLPSRKKCTKVLKNNYTYYLGRLGNYAVIHVQCHMGSISSGAAITTVTAALNEWRIKAIVMVGIAFGLDRTKQRIGDILVSKTIIPYDIKRIGKKETLARGAQPPAGATLLNRFENHSGWNANIRRAPKPKVIIANLLSGESLIDNRKHRLSLQRTFPHASGGDMEGAGVQAAAHEKNVEWIIVKGICDYADGNKAKNKTKNQIKAAIHAVSLCKHVFSTKDAFAPLGCTDLSFSNNGRRISASEVLFDVYELKHEAVYHTRPIDHELARHLSNGNIWVSGPSGCGKTNSLRRSLLKSNTDSIFIDFSRCIGSTPICLAEALHLELVDFYKADPTKYRIQRKSQHTILSSLANLIINHIRKPTLLLLDEIPLQGEHFLQFCQILGALLITLSNKGHSNTTLAIASLDDPTTTFHHTQKKVLPQIRFFQMTLWKKADIDALFKRANSHLKLSLTKGQKQVIIERANGNPRTLKSILRSLNHFSNDASYPFERIISELNPS